MGWWVTEYVLWFLLSPLFKWKYLLLLYCLMLIMSSNTSSTVKTKVNVYMIFFFIVIPSHFTVCVVRGILCLSLSFPRFQDSISKVSHLYWSAALHEFLRSSPQMLVLAACNSSFCSQQKVLGRPGFCELDLRMKDEGAALHYILQVSLTLWKIFNSTINWKNLFYASGLCS